MDEVIGFHPRDEFEIREESIGPTILLASGAYFSFEHPERTPLPVEDIAHALSNICRFTGHCRGFYSVAQHAVLTSYLAPPEFAFHALHHDDVEAVMGDMSSPLKRLIPQYKAIERRVEAVILAQFGLSAETPPEVKRADLVALRTEQRDLMHKAGGLWKSLDGIEPSHEFRVAPMPPEVAAFYFLRRHSELLELAKRLGPQALPTGEAACDPPDALRFGANVAETLLRIGRSIGFGRAQQILGEQWEAEHDCAPRGRMGVTVGKCIPPKSWNKRGQDAYRRGWEEAILAALDAQGGGK